MDLGIVVAVFPLIFLAELPDKTMFASLVLATRGHPRLVWLGAATLSGQTGPKSPSIPVMSENSLMVGWPPWDPPRSPG